jgi:outer membrane immunogenic protein
MKERMLAGLIATVLLGGSAGAADMRVYQPAVPIISYFSWTGCYVGGNAGGLFASRSWKDQIPGDPFFGTDFGSYTASGALAGVQGGCNYQPGRGVVGIQVDYDWSNASAYNTPPSLFAPLFLTDRSQTKSLASVTGRVGYAWDRFLAYLKAGGAWQRSTYSLLVAGQVAASTSERRGGWTAGIGGEYAFLDWLTAFVEYDYYRFGTNTNAFFCAACGFAAVVAPFDIITDIHVVKTGINFKFGL